MKSMVYTREKLSSISELEKHQNTDNLYRYQNGKGSVSPKSFAVPIILEDSCGFAFVSLVLAPVMAHTLLRHRAYKDIPK